MKNSKIFLFISILIICTWGFDSQQYAKKAEFDWVQDKLNSMTLREKIAQMVVSYSDGFSLSENSNEYIRIKNLIENQKIGGLIFFKGNAVQEAGLINKFQSLSDVPLLISQDFERGTGMRLEDGSIFPNNMGLGATRNPDLAYKMGLQIAKECKAIGVHQNYAPVMDVNNNPNNPIINVRSFGEDPVLVSELGIAMIKGLQEGGIISTAKHFPGHGDTEIDTHNDLPVLNFNQERLKQIELYPFQNAINNGVKSVMTAHISFPALESNSQIPASLSPKIVGKLLTDEMSFSGLKITDALNMAGITKHFSTKQVAIMCVEAGIDLILMPQGEIVTIDAIESEIKSGKISESRIEISARKILEAKKWLGLDKNKTVDADHVSSIVNSEDSKNLSQLIADKSITLVKSINGNIPFGKRMVKRNETCLIVSLNNGNEKANSDYFLKTFSEKGDKFFSTISSYDIMGEVKNAEEIIKDAKSYSYVILPIYAKVKIKTGTVGLPKSQLDLINGLISNGIQVCVVSFGNPYLLKGFKDVDSYICAYGDGISSINASVKCLFGDIVFKGKLPITISEEYKFGTGITN